MTALATYLLALQSIPRVGSWTAVRAARAFPSPDALFAASELDLIARLDKRSATPFVAFDSENWVELERRAEEQVARHRDSGVELVAVDDPGYPPLMRLAPRPAAVLYVRGKPAALTSTDTVAVIGTRKPTAHGVTIGRRLAHYMADAGFSVISGLARGIDTAGHEGAIDARGTTIAILGSAIDKIYPASNGDLAERIEAGGGALISEYPMGFPTSGRHFVERDRLQAAMSIGVVAIQTGVDGGTLHTVRFAREARRLIAVPRPIPSEQHDPAYGGIHALTGGGDVEILEGADDYPDLTSRLRAHRDWLLSAPSPMASDGVPTSDVNEQDRQVELGL